MPEVQQTRRIIHIDPHQAGKVVGLLHAVLGIILGVIFLLVGLVSSESREFIAFGVLAPFVYGILGYLSTFIGTALFNWAAGRMGGVSVTSLVDEPAIPTMMAS